MNKFYKIFALFAFTLIGVSAYFNLFHPDYGGQFSKGEMVSSVELGKQIYAQKNCKACHGRDGADPSVGAYPRVNNQPVDYTSRQLTDIMEGGRTNGMSAIMRNAVGSLSAEEIEALANYLHSIN